MLTKDLLRVSRRGGGYRPLFADADDEPLARRVLGVYREHVGEPRATLEAALTDLEREGEAFKLIRGFAKLLDREATFETRAAVDPERVRDAVFRRAEERGVVTSDERTAVLREVADRFGVAADEIEAALYADLDDRQVLATFEPRWSAAGLVEQYNLSLAQTALFDATEVRVRSADPKALVSAVKRLRLMYEIRKVPDERARLDGHSGPPVREVIVTGPDALFRRSRRYGTRFARLLRTVAKAPEWYLEAEIDDRGTERLLELDAGDVTVPNVEPLAEPAFDSGVEADFAARFRSLDLDWDLVREPEPLESGAYVVIPDFAFDWRHASFRVFFEIMGFWTPEYVEKKLSRLADLEDVELLVAVDESLGVGEEIEALDHRVVPYSGSVRVKDVRDALRRYEETLVADAVADLPDDLVPDADAVTLAELAAEYGVSESAVEEKSFPAHERVGRTLVRPAVLDDLRGRIEPEMSLSEAEAVLGEAGIDDASAALSALGYRVEWNGLSGGTVREKDAQ
ncbi:DUF790 family protein [Halomarina halobia]|uniref:DUF790 family protein n=1 Tax=Halomarina halobia TaxID=3033386 RepID=A0ABD6AC86_9EURY|nr:DUF790 family protein [Halomarina sp. PSR21]